VALKKEPEKHANHERWLVSYGDFLTLLFAVFVALYAMGQTDKKKSEDLMQSLRESFGYSTLAAAGQKGVLPAEDIRLIPAIKPEMALIPISPKMPPAGPKQGGLEKGRGKGRAEEQQFKEIMSSIEAYLDQAGRPEQGLVVDHPAGTGCQPEGGRLLWFRLGGHQAGGLPADEYHHSKPWCSTITRCGWKGTPTTYRSAPPSSPPTGNCQVPVPPTCCAT